MSAVEDYWRTSPGNYAADAQQFHSWFNNCESEKDSIAKGASDFFHRVFTADFYEYVGNPQEKTCLEIGFGGGRLMNHASKVFRHAYGIDIHDAFDVTQAFLASQGNSNFTLVSDPNSIPDESIDFVYSFITFQHFSSWKVSQDYIEWIAKIVKDGGVGIIYFGEFHEKGSKVEEHSDPIKYTSTLLVTPDLAIAEIGKYFQVIEWKNNLMKQLWASEKSGQFYVKFAKKGIKR